MFWLGLASTTDAPGYLRATIPFGWASLSIALPLMLWRSGQPNLLHWLGLAFLAFAALSIAWTPFWQDGAWALWQWMLVGMAFWLGSTLASLRYVLLGMAVMLSVSSAAALAQVLGDTTFLIPGAGYPGIYYNPMIAGEYAALVIVGLVVYEEWYYIPTLLPGLFLSASRGAWLSLAIGLIAWRFRRWWILGCVCLGAMLGVLWFHSPHDDLRLHFWDLAIHSLYPLGWGVGAWTEVLVPPYHPEYVHNDFLQLAWEFGFGAAPAFFILFACALHRRSLDWPILVMGLFMACVSFPFHAPVSAFLLALAAGRVSRDWAGDSVGADNRRSRELSRGNQKPPRASEAWSAYLSSQLGPTQ